MAELVSAVGMGYDVMSNAKFFQMSLLRPWQRRGRLHTWIFKWRVMLPWSFMQSEVVLKSLYWPMHTCKQPAIIPVCHQCTPLSSPCPTLFVYSLFNDAVSNSHYIESVRWVTSKRWIGNRSGGKQSWPTVFATDSWGKPLKTSE